MLITIRVIYLLPTNFRQNNKSIGLVRIVRLGIDSLI